MISNTNTSHGPGYLETRTPDLHDKHKTRTRDITDIAAQRYTGVNSTSTSLVIGQ